MCENEGLRILVKWVYEVESSDNNARVCKSEYFSRSIMIDLGNDTY